jgi:hypothetical protein
MEEDDVRFYFSYAGDISGMDNLTVKQGLILDESNFIQNTIDNVIGRDFLVKIKNVNSDDNNKIDSFLDELKR